ncbi:pheromone-regulated protein prm10 [Basidiobolus ranarum]|uniref:Pheromone-regulated protein prm10 n=1 Tax=Basidiobolus ranarum TaxID=34480 RepID=A0ABR2W7A3_9FUNG
MPDGYFDIEHPSGASVTFNFADSPPIIDSPLTTPTIELSPPSGEQKYGAKLKRSKTLRRKRKEAKNLVKSVSDIHSSNAGGSILSQLLKLQNLTRPRSNNNGPREKEKNDYLRPSSRVQSTSSLASLIQSSSNMLGFQSTRTSFSDDSAMTSGINTPLTSPLILEERLNITANIADILLKQDYLTLLSRAMVIYGSPSHRLEQNMYLNSQALRVESSYAFLPGVALITFGDKNTHTSDTHIIKADRDYDMYRLERVYEISRCVIHGEIDLEDAFDKLEMLIDEPPIYSWWVRILNYAVCSFVVCPLMFNGNWVDAVVSAVLSACICALGLLSTKLFNYANVFEISAAVVTAFVATAFHNHICYMPVVMSSVVLLLPGLSLTTSIIELAAKSLISGVVRLVYALVISFMLGFGLSFGSNIWKVIDSSKIGTENCTTVSPYWYFILCPINAITYSIYLNAAPRQWPFMIILSGVGFTVSYFTSKVLDPTTSSAISTFAIAVIGNLYSRITHRLGYVAVLGATIMLVPGSLGVRGILAALSDDSQQGTGLPFQMIVIAMSLAVGLFIGSLIVYPMGKKRTSMMMF